MCFGIVCVYFNFSLQSLFSPCNHFGFGFGQYLVFFFFLNKYLSLYQNTIYMAKNLNMPTNYLSNKLLKCHSFITLVSF